MTNYAQQHNLIKTINWEDIELQIENNANYRNITHTGFYTSSESFNKVDAKLVNLTFTPATKLEKENLTSIVNSPEISLKTSVVYVQKKAQVEYSFLPYRLNPESNEIERVSSYEVIFTLSNDSRKNSISRTYAKNSLLQEGNWYKIKVDTTGIFKLTYNQIEKIGLSKPENARLYSYGGKQLPYANSEENFDDLVEIPIEMYKGSDGIFNAGDYILFYAEGPTIWKFDANLNMFVHEKHHYSNYTYLFISDYEGTGGRRINLIDNSNLTENYSTSTFDSYQCHELNTNNLIQSGRTWYGEEFRPGNSIDFNFTFPNIVSTKPLQLYTNIVGRKKISSQSCYFSISANNTKIGNIDVLTKYGDYTYAYAYDKYFEISNPESSINLDLKFNGESSDMEGYLDFICLNAKEKLIQHESQITFRDKNSASPNTIAKFEISNNGKNLSIWNISDGVNPYELKTTSSSSTTSFKIATDTIEQFISFDRSSFLTPIIDGDDLGIVENQNLHGVGMHDMIIVTHPLFMKQANELAEWRRSYDGLSVYVTTPDKIYNEFSSGSPDISAIRNFIRMLYDNSSSESQAPKYLLLLGDGSYDNLSQKSDNSNFIPTYQNQRSLQETLSYVSDDFFGLLDLGEGEHLVEGYKEITGMLDIAIGRFPVQNTDEAQLLVDKIKHYQSSASFGNWRTKICLIGDDEDGGLHMTQAEEIGSEIIRVNHPEYNVDKVFLDAFKQISTPSGQRFPYITQALNDKVEQGALIIDYVGHGNPRILAHEEILGVDDIRSWKNWDKLALFVTASCEVGRFDDFNQYSFGEWLVLNPDGGGIAALTTTRVVYSGGNHALSKTFFNNVFNTDITLGDALRIAKNKQGATGTNHRNFSLLGDPALKLAVPKNKIVIGSINNKFLPINTNIANIPTSEKIATQIYEPGDTINALSKATVQGFITNISDAPIYDNGVLYITIYDKNDTLYTYGQDNPALEFTLQDKILYKGKASIVDGFFEFDFIVPKDINYTFGKGKISLYAILDSTEAIGYSENIVIGGNSDDIDLDINGPEISLYINDTLFVNGGITDENPLFLAHLTDTNGINTTGNGFGHNITATLDGNQDNIYILNSYYEGNLDEYNSGKVKYPFYNLTSGYHYIEFKVWDIYNNSTESSLEFYVHEGNDMVIENMYNAPNPFYDETHFSFEHNVGSGNFDIKIRIFDLMGNEVSQIIKKNNTAGYAIEPIAWNGTSFGGVKLPKGMYIYRVEISTVDGNIATKSSKLMIFR